MQLLLIFEQINVADCMHVQECTIIFKERTQEIVISSLYYNSPCMTIELNRIA